MKNLIIFDLDGTLADTRSDLANAVNLTRDDHGLPRLSYEEIIGYVGNGAVKLIERSFGDLDGADIGSLTEEFKQKYADNLIIDTELYPDVAEGLRQLKSDGNLLAVLSNKPGDLCRRMSAHFNLDEFFTGVYGGGDADELKPDPAGIEMILAEAAAAGFKRKEGNVFMVGDHYTDLQSALNAGIKSVLCRYGFGDPDGLAADFEVDGFSELPGLISEL